MHLLLPIIIGLVGVVTVACVGTLAGLLLAALLGRRQVPAAPPNPLMLAVIVPAHNEDLVLAGTLDSLARQDYPCEYCEVVVVADNCTDATAELARSHNVTVLERRHPTERGKGYALNFAVQSLRSRPTPPDGYLIVDADTWVAPDFMRRMAARLASTEDPQQMTAWQGRYGVLNFGESWRAGLMAAAFDLINHVKPLGREACHFSVGLKGNGMAFSRTVAETLPWPGGSLTEDLDYGLELARRFGVRVGYAYEARVLAQMPVTAAQAGSQRSRWERGRLRMVRERALPMMIEGLRTRNRLLLDMGWDLLVPPLAELGALWLAWCGLITLGTATRFLPHPSIWIAAAALTGLGLVGYILGGLRVAGAPPAAYTALLYAPFYALWKCILLLGGRMRQRGSTEGEEGGGSEWVRTARAPLLSSPPESLSSESLSSETLPPPAPETSLP